MTVWDILIVLLFGYPLPPEMVEPGFPMFLQRSGGLLLTVLITVLSLVIGICIGTALALCQRENPKAVRRGTLDRLLSWSLRNAARGFVVCIRSLPIMLLVLLMFYVPYPLVGLRYPNVVLALATFSLYTSVYMCEITRAGLRAMDPRLRDVGHVLGLTPRQILLRIELPLIWRPMMPDMVNVAITVFKDTSALAVVAVPELTYTARQMLMAEPLNYGLVLLVVLAYYWVPATLLSAFVHLKEQRRVQLLLSSALRNAEQP
jgi:His/Glu/Gln/Arg/opine family amino acid ABC transporter permease subunit